MTAATKTPADTAPISRSQRLKDVTRDVHDVLDKSIMAGNIFAGREQFARFLRMQYRFHRDIEALYGNTALCALLPNLQERRRLERIASDLSDLGTPLPAPAEGALREQASLAEALGWLYVAEGSNLGGTILYKFASERLGLGQSFGASHLAAHPDGAARHWREFTTALDSVQLTPEQDDEMLLAALAAFRAAQQYVHEEIQ